MGVFRWLVSAALIAILVAFCVSAWRVHQGHGKPGPFLNRMSVVLICGLMAWQAMHWLRTEHPGVDQSRVVAVWIELLCSAGICAVMIAVGFLGPRRTVSR